MLNWLSRLSSRVKGEENAHSWRSRGLYILANYSLCKNYFLVCPHIDRLPSAHRHNVLIYRCFLRESGRLGSPRFGLWPPQKLLMLMIKHRPAACDAEPRRPQLGRGSTVTEWQGLRLDLTQREGNWISAKPCKKCMALCSLGIGEWLRRHPPLAMRDGVIFCPFSRMVPLPSECFLERKHEAPGYPPWPGAFFNSLITRL